MQSELRYVPETLQNGGRQPRDKIVRKIQLLKRPASEKNIFLKCRDAVVGEIQAQNPGIFAKTSLYRGDEIVRDVDVDVAFSKALENSGM